MPKSTIFQVKSFWATLIYIWRFFLVTLLVKTEPQPPAGVLSALVKPRLLTQAQEGGASKRILNDAFRGRTNKHFHLQTNKSLNLFILATYIPR